VAQLSNKKPFLNKKAHGYLNSDFTSLVHLCPWQSYQTHPYNQINPKNVLFYRVSFHTIGLVSGNDIKICSAKICGCKEIVSNIYTFTKMEKKIHGLLQANTSEVDVYIPDKYANVIVELSATVKFLIFC
jgi:hypothetical protein